MKAERTKGKLARQWPASQRFAYLRRVFHRCNWLELHGISPTGPIVVDLERFFVPLASPTPLREEESKEEKAKTLLSWRMVTPVSRRRHGSGDTDGAHPEDTRTIEKLIARHPRLVVSAPPGAGKSTVLAYVATVLAHGLGREDKQLLTDRLGLRGTTPYPFPVYVPALHRWLRSRAGRTTRSTRLIAPLAETLEERFGEAAPDTAVLDGLCRAGQAHLLLDGFDELDDELARDLLLNAIADLGAAYPFCHTTVMTRSSIFDWPVERLLRRGFGATLIFPFDSPEIHEFTLRWIVALYAGAVRLEEGVDIVSGIRNYDSLKLTAAHRRILRGLNGRAHGLYRALSFHHVMGELAGSPLLATAACGMIYNHDTLPQRREQFLELLVKALLSLRRTFGHEEQQRDYLDERACRQALQTFAANRDHSLAMTELERLSLLKLGFLVSTTEGQLQFRHDGFDEVFKDATT